MIWGVAEIERAGDVSRVGDFEVVEDELSFGLCKPQISLAVGTKSSPAAVRGEIDARHIFRRLVEHLNVCVLMILAFLKARKAEAGQKEMLMPITGKKQAKVTAAKKLADKPQRRPA